MARSLTPAAAMHLTRALRHPLLVAALLVGTLGGCGGEGAGDGVPTGIEPGNAAPALTGTLAGGGDYDLADERGRPAVVLFYRSEACGLCRLRLEQLEQNLGAYRSAGARVVAVTLDPPELAARTAERVADDLRIVSVDSATFQRWGLLEEGGGAPLPGAFVLDGRGAILFRHMGGDAGDRSSDAALLTVLESQR